MESPRPVIAAACRPHPFQLALSVMLRGEQLHISLAVVNPSDEPLEFDAALRCHLRVADIHRAAVRGLEGLEWLDRVRLPPADSLMDGKPGSMLPAWRVVGGIMWRGEDAACCGWADGGCKRALHEGRAERKSLESL